MNTRQRLWSALICAFALLWFAPASEAKCSGSGQTWSCTAGSSAGQINSAISKAKNGATITLAAGSYNAEGIDVAPRLGGVTLICETQGACIMTSAQVFKSCANGLHTGLVRFSGFDFSSPTPSPSPSRRSPRATGRRSVHCGRHA